MHNPVDIQSLLQSCLVFCIGIGTPAIGSTTTSQRCIEGFKMIRMNIFGSNRRCGVGMLWRGGLILWSFAPALMLLRPFILEPHFHAFAQGFLGSSSFAIAEHLTTNLKQQTPLAPFTISQQCQSACLLDDIAQETHCLLKQLAVFASTLYLPQKTGCPIH